jgi:hypothetical protein
MSRAFPKPLTRNVLHSSTPRTSHAFGVLANPTAALLRFVRSSGDGRQLLYGSKRNGIRQLFVMTLADLGETQLTHLKIGFGAMWPHWQPAESAQSLPIP